MSDLGAIFHVKKNGTQYDAHAYTTLDECPTPNLKIKTKSGTQGYVKLTTNGSGDVPFRVKPKSGSTTYQVMASAVPTGSVTYSFAYAYKDFTVPNSVKVVNVVWDGKQANLVGVTPGKTYKLKCTLGGVDSDKAVVSSSNNVAWCNNNGLTGGYKYTISWSPTINTYTPNVKDY